ncbi:MAG: MlaD family protein [Desulfobulbaceae bacterium]|nr:MlaD family protein [Desulfobulbaceae bacterium]
MQQPVLKKKRFISPVWLLPFLALCIGGWLLYTSYQKAGVNITIHFDSAAGITPGKTKIIYKGIPIGTVKDVEIDDNLQGVTLQVEMIKKTRSGLVEDTKFWVVRPEISAGRISGLETLLSGSYIAVRKGKSTKESRSFTGLSTPPPADTDVPGLHITLRSPTLYSLQRGSRVYSKNLQIGLVENYTLESDGMITLKIFIKPEFSHLVRKGSRFWNASGLSVTGDLQSGLTVNMESLASLIYGGITCATPEQLADSPPAESGQTYTLYKDFEDAEYGISMTLQLATGEGIIAGKTRILYRGLKAGVVKSLDINDDTFHTVTATILLDPRAEVILRKNTHFWVIRPQVSIEGIKNLETLLSGPYITFQPGTGSFRNNFVVEPSPMPIPTLRPGTHFLLEAKDSGSLNIGAPVLYRKIAVGEIIDIKLSKNGQGVQTTILVYQPYDAQVQENSVFWNVSGLQVKGSLSNFKINLSSMRTMIAGGITFTNPPAGSNAKQPARAKPDSVFPIYEGYREAVQKESSLQPQGLALQVRTKNPANVDVGSPVLFNNITVGEVMDLTLAHKSTMINIDLLIFKKFQHLITGSTRFFNLSGIKAEAGLQGITVEAGPLEAIINGGISFYNPEKTTKLKRRRTFTLYRNREAADNADRLKLSLRLHNAKGINKYTKIRYQGIEIGRVIDVHFDQNLDQVLARAVVRKEAEKLFRTDSVLSIVGPQIGLSGIQNLDTVVGGSYITLRPGTGEPAHEFTVLPQAPGRSETYAGLNLILESKSRGSLKPGSPIYYRQIPVGRITGYELSPTGQQVWIGANIQPEYQHLIHTGTKFWNASGIEVSGGVFSGMTISTESMEAMVRGGVALATPEGEEMGEAAAGGDHFVLAKKAEAGWKSWAPELATAPNNEIRSSTVKPEAKTILILPNRTKKKATSARKVELPMGE